MVKEQEVCLFQVGFTSPERFVRTAFLKTHIQVPKSRSEAIMTCFHIMNSVSIPKGIVLTDRRTYDYTKYIAFINTNTCEYYFKTYENDQIITASLGDYCINNKDMIFIGSIIRLPDIIRMFLVKKLSIKYLTFISTDNIIKATRQKCVALTSFILFQLLYSLIL